MHSAEFIELMGLKTSLLSDEIDGSSLFLLIDSVFDPEYYLSQNPDVAKASLDPLEHFILYGCREGRQANARFDSDYYLKKYGDLLGANQVPILHFLISGQNQGFYQNYTSELIGDSGLEDLIQKQIGNTGFIHIFDSEYYNARYLNEALEYPFVEALTHFVNTGFDNRFDISEDSAFDARFYIAQYAGEIGFELELPSSLDFWISANPVTLDDEFLNVSYSHFIKTGYMDGFHPNLARFIEAKYGLVLKPYEAELIKAELISVLALNESCSPQEYLDKIFKSDDFNFLLGVKNINSAQMMDPGLYRLLAKIGDHHAKNGKDQSAEIIYGLIRTASNDSSYLNAHHSDVLDRLGCKGAAYFLRRDGIKKSVKNEWLYLNLSNFYNTQSANLPASKTNFEMSALFPGSYHITNSARTENKDLFKSSWNGSIQRAKVFGLEAAQDYLSEVLDYVFQVQPKGSSKKQIQSVALIANLDLPQCKLYRVDQKVEQFRLAGFTVSVFSHSTEVEDFINHRTDFDAAIFYRVPAFSSIEEAIRLARISGVRTFYEIDDQIFDQRVYPPSFESYSNEIDYTQYLSLGVSVPLFDKAMRLCEFGIASTPTIQKAMEGRVQSGKVFLHRNAMGSIHEFAQSSHKLDKKTNDVIEIFYGSGTKAHREIIYEIIGPVFKELATEFGSKVKFRIMGYLDPEQEALKEIGSSLTIVEPVWDIEEYWDQLKQSDLNIAVLERSELTDGKSEIKWLEAAMFGIPSVVTPTQTYKEVLTDGKDVIFAETKEEFLTSLRKLITNSAYRKKIGKNAKSLAKRNYSKKSLAGNITDIMRACDGNVRAVKKRLLIVNVFYAPQSIGGATRVVEDNVREIRERYGDEYDIEVVCTLEGADQPYKIFEYINDGIRVYAIATPHYEDIDKAPKDQKMGSVFEKILEKVDPELVHFHCIQRLTASIVNVTRLKRIPYVITLHDGWWFSPNQFLINEQDTIETYDYAVDFNTLEPRAKNLRKALEGAQKILPVSDNFGEIVKKTGLRNIKVIENGVSKIEPSIRINSPDGRVRLAHIGGNSRHKGIHLVKNALHSYPFKNLHLTLIDHSFNPSDQVFTRWGSTPVTIRGKFPSSEISSLYASVDVLLAPSIWPESFGLVTREALKCGCWAVGSKVGSIGKCITDKKNGFVVDTTNHLDLRRVLKIIDEKPEVYLKPPKLNQKLRKSKEQADDLVDLYRSFM